MRGSDYQHSHGGNLGEILGHREAVLDQLKICFILITESIWVVLEPPWGAILVLSWAILESSWCHLVTIGNLWLLPYRGNQFIEQQLLLEIFAFAGGILQDPTIGKSSTETQETTMGPLAVTHT